LTSIPARLLSVLHSAWYWLSEPTALQRAHSFLKRCCSHLDFPERRSKWLSAEPPRVSLIALSRHRPQPGRHVSIAQAIAVWLAPPIAVWLAPAR
jgi:hypothetical protein